MDIKKHTAPMHGKRHGAQGDTRPGEDVHLGDVPRATEVAHPEYSGDSLGHIDNHPFGSVLVIAAPVMLGYVSIGLPCGILESGAGLAPLMIFVLSASFYTGAGQFMLPNLLVSGVPMLSSVASITFVNTRQLLYSASFAPYFEGVNKMLTFFFAATVTDESFGVNLTRFADPYEEWTAHDALLLNMLCMFAWATANFVGSLVGSVLSIPVALASFAMTSIFVCLLVNQNHNASTLTCALCAVLGVIACKLCGLTSPAIIVGSIFGMTVAMLVEEAHR